MIDLDLIIDSYKDLDVVESLRKYSNLEGVSFNKPAPLEEIDSFERVNCKMPAELRSLYLFSNGFVTDTLELLSVFDKKNPKKTWDSVNRAMNSDTKGFAYVHENASNYCMFGRLAPPNYAVAYNKQSGVFSFESEKKIIETTLSLRDFLLVCLNSETFLKPLAEYF